MEEYIQKFSKYTKLNESIAALTEEVEVKEYKVKDKHKAEDRLEELGIDWKDLIAHPDGTGFGKDGNLMAHYDEEDGMLYVHVESESKDTEDKESDSDMMTLLDRYAEGDTDEWENDDWDSEPSDSELKDFDEF